MAAKIKKNSKKASLSAKKKKISSTLKKKLIIKVPKKKKSLPSRKNKLTPETPKKKNGRRSDWEAHHLLIENAYVKTINKEGRIPTCMEIAKMTGISDATAHSHIQEFSWNEEKKKHKVIVGKMMGALEKRILKGGDPAALKLYKQLIFDWSEKNITEHKGELNVKAQVMMVGNTEIKF